MTDITTHKHRPTIRSIQEAAAREFNVPVEWMRQPSGASGSQARDAAWPRQAAMALAAELTRHNMSRVGYYFGGRDHSTVWHAKRAVAERRKGDLELEEKMQRVRESVGI